MRCLKLLPLLIDNHMLKLLYGIRHGISSLCYGLNRQIQDLFRGRAMKAVMLLALRIIESGKIKSGKLNVKYVRRRAIKQHDGHNTLFNVVLTNSTQRFMGRNQMSLQAVQTGYL